MTNKKITSVTDNNYTKLIISKEEFMIMLSDRISQGIELQDRNVVNIEEFNRLKDDYDDWDDYNLEFLKHSFNNENNEYLKNYDETYSSLYTALGGNQSPAEELKRFKENIYKKIKVLKQLKNKTVFLKQHAKVTPTESTKINELDKTKVFIVHGHDEEAKTKTARFVEKLGFEAIILHEKASGSKTIIEKIEEYSNVGFGIILYTPCDKGAKQTDNNLKSRARQNVVFEHGFLIGKIGRDKVCALIKGDIETPNDISGVIYIKMDLADAWRYAIADEMKNAGYAVDKNRI